MHISLLIQIIDSGILLIQVLLSYGIVIIMIIVRFVMHLNTIKPMLAPNITIWICEMLSMANLTFNIPKSGAGGNIQVFVSIFLYGSSWQIQVFLLNI